MPRRKAGPGPATAPAPAAAPPEQPPAPGGAAQVQAATDIDLHRGYLGHKVDPTPNEHYTVAGVLAGLPTPETTQETRNG